MKRLEDYTRDELLALTEETLADIVDLECAIAGVPPLPAEPVAPVRPANISDVEIFECCGLPFLSEDDAVQVMRLVAGMRIADVRYEWQLSTNYVKGSTLAAPSIECKRLASAARYAELEPALRTHKVASDAYDAARKAWQEIASRRAEVRDAVLERISAARGESQDRERLQQHFARYLELADGDRSVAVRFLRDTCSALAAAHPDVMAELERVEPTHAPEASSLAELL